MKQKYISASLILIGLLISSFTIINAATNYVRQMAGISAWYIKVPAESVRNNDAGAAMIIVLPSIIIVFGCSILRRICLPYRQRWSNLLDYGVIGLLVYMVVKTYNTFPIKGSDESFNMINVDWTVVTPLFAFISSIVYIVVTLRAFIKRRKSHRAK